EHDWFALSEARRVSLFRESLEAHRDDEELRPALRRAFLQNVDALLDKARGAELEQWLGFLTRLSTTRRVEAEEPSRDTELVRAVVLGERGERLLALGPEQGFRERAAVALWRGTEALERGALLDAMRAF